MRTILTLTLLLLFTGCGSHPKISVSVNDNKPSFKVPRVIEAPQAVAFNLEKERMNEAFDKMNEIGGGRNFLTLMVDLPQRLPGEYTLYAVALDRDGVPVRKISGYHYDPKLEGRNHTWFYFVLYSPGNRKTASEAIKFIVKKGDEIIMEKEVEWKKEWGNETNTLISDLPSPPEEIPGTLELKDYTFFAKGDTRKPGGYYIEGKIVGSNGEWTHFIPTSEILGQEPEREIELQSGRGWLELTTGRTHAMQEAVAPLKPYVEGWWDGKGYFHPRPVKIQ